MTTEGVSRPPFPRRALLAAAVAGVTVGAAGWLGWLGVLREPAAQDFRFSRGVALATGEAARLEAYLSRALLDDRIHVTILGHSGTAGDEAANRTLSQSRADAVAEMARKLGVPAARVTARGVGGSMPTARPSGASDREYQSGLARVTVSLQRRS